MARAILLILAVLWFGAAAYAYFTDARQTLRALASGDAVVEITPYPLELAGLSHFWGSDRWVFPLKSGGRWHS